ncbi:hypothetical protein A0J61_04761 [Choanephora cucurbitarum]|uniref:Uncharacterized protein n=1 Tax=Choanephora cucurbitarum TaxID=101091 RepID=A0A1C7NDM0_9FUNG|nr:hypothetical protein A0J61_04761 [Choanephora cucurbitarum]
MLISSAFSNFCWCHHPEGNLKSTPFSLNNQLIASKRLILKLKKATSLSYAHISTFPTPLVTKPTALEFISPAHADTVDYWLTFAAAAATLSLHRSPLHNKLILRKSSFFVRSFNYFSYKSRFWCSSSSFSLQRSSARGTH